MGYDRLINENRTIRYYIRVNFQIGDYIEKDIILFIIPLAYYYTILGLP